MHSPRVDNGRVEHNDEKCVFMPSNTSWQVPIYIASVDCVQVVVQNYIDIWVWPLLGLASFGLTRTHTCFNVCSLGIESSLTICMVCLSRERILVDSDVKIFPPHPPKHHLSLLKGLLTSDYLLCLWPTYKIPLNCCCKSKKMFSWQSLS